MGPDVRPKIVVDSAIFQNGGDDVHVEVTGGEGGTVELWKQGAVALEAVGPIPGSGEVDFVGVNTPNGCYYVVAKEQTPSTNADIMDVTGGECGELDELEVEAPPLSGQASGQQQARQTIRISVRVGRSHPRSRVDFLGFSTATRSSDFDFAHPQEIPSQNTNDDGDILEHDVTIGNEGDTHAVVFMTYTESSSGRAKKYVKTKRE